MDNEYENQQGLYGGETQPVQPVQPVQSAQPVQSTQSTQAPVQSVYQQSAYQQPYYQQPYYQQPYVQPEQGVASKKSVGRLIMGIIAIVLSVLMLMQSCTVAGFGSVFDEAAATAGVMGVIAALLMLAAGIVDIATRGAQGNAGNITSIVLYGFGAFSTSCYGYDFPDLYIWAGLCAMFAVIDLVIVIRRSM